MDNSQRCNPRRALRAKHPDLARAWPYAHLLFALLVEEAVAELEVSLPSECGGRQVSLWRCFQLAAMALLCAIMPRLTGSTLVRLVRSRRLHEPNRKRKLQVAAFLKLVPMG